MTTVVTPTAEIYTRRIIYSPFLPALTPTALNFGHCVSVRSGSIALIEESPVKPVAWSRVVPVLNRDPLCGCMGSDLYCKNDWSRLGRHEEPNRLASSAEPIDVFIAKMTAPLRARMRISMLAPLEGLNNATKGKSRPFYNR